MARHNRAPESNPNRDRRRIRWWVHGGVLLALTAALILAFGAGGWQSKALKIGPQPVPKPIKPPPTLVTSYPVPLPAAAANAARELAGSGDGSPVRWLPSVGAWGLLDGAPKDVKHWSSPWWWQSALDLRALARYLEVTRNTDPAYEQLIDQTYQLNVRKPGTNMPLNFGNMFMDDTAWWGLAWLEVARYELNVRHDFSEATRFLNLSEWDANYIWNTPRACNGGIEWQRHTPPDTITNAQFASLAAQLAQLREQPGPWQDLAAARKWTVQARQTLWWLHASHLINLTTGRVWDGYTKSCQITGGSLPYTEGEVADALIQQAAATGKRRDLIVAQHFLNTELGSGALYHGVIQEPCETERTMCLGSYRLADATTWKSIFVDAVADWRGVTGSTAYDWFMTRQAQAVLSNATSDGAHLTPCRTPHDCQIGFYWAKPVPPSGSPVQVGPGTQEAGLSVLSDALAVASAPHPVDALVG